jgi:vancomycin resistance protein YoaR
VRSSATVAFAGATAACLVVIAALAATAFWTTHATPSDHVRRNVTLADVDIGGISRDDIRAVVGDRLERYAESTVTLTLPDGPLQLKARQLGYRPQIEATVAQVEALGVPLKREQLVAEWSAEAPREIKPGYTIDQSRLDAAVDTFAGRLERPAVDARLRVNPDVTVELVPGQAGQRVDRAELARRLGKAFAALESTVAVPVEPVRPSVADSDATEALKAAERFLARPLEVRAAGQSWTLSRGDLASWVVFERSDGPEPKLRLGLHPERPRNWLTDRGREIERPARDARLRIKGGQVTVLTPEEPGVELDELTSLAVLLASGTSEERRVELAVKTLPPRVGAGDAAKLRFPDVLGDAGTVYGGSIPERNHNVELAAARLDGVVVPPGATFSFNESVGRTRIKDGYKMAFGITSGEDGVQTVPSVAGGICQVATTLFHSAYWAGLPIVERSHHAYWIPKYGVPPRGMTGLDATVDEDAGLDFRFKNATDAPLLVQSAVDGNRLTFRLHGTKPGWEITSSGPSLSNFVKHDPTFVRQEEGSLAAGRAIQVEEARDGFDAVVVRTVTRPGGAVDRLEVRSSYAPSRNVVLVGTRR